MIMDDLVNLNHKITYNDPLLAEKFNITDENEMEQLHDVIYKYDLISVFGLDDFLEDVIFEKIQKIYIIMIADVDIQKLCPDIESFMILFSYDYLNLFYPCICEFITEGNITSEKITVLKKILTK
jgi:hypothetical protein